MNHQTLNGKHDVKMMPKKSANSTRPVPSQSGLALEITRPTLPTNRHTDRDEWNNVLDSVPVTVTISDPVVHCAHGIVLLSLHRLAPIWKKACFHDNERYSRPLVAYKLKGDTEHTAGNMKSVSPLLRNGLAWKWLVASIHDTTWNQESQKTHTHNDRNPTAGWQTKKPIRD